MRVLVDSRLWSHPKLIHLAKLLRLNPSEAGGYLVRLWNWCAEYRLDGNLTGLDACQIAAASGRGDSLDPAQRVPRRDAERFVRILIESRWIDSVNGGSALEVHDWHEHQGRYIDKILRERERKRKEFRGVSAEPPRPVSVSVSVPGSFPSSIPGGEGNGTETRTPPDDLLRDYVRGSPTETERKEWDRLGTFDGGEARRNLIAKALILRGVTRKLAWLEESLLGVRDHLDPWGDGSDGLVSTDGSVEQPKCPVCGVRMGALKRDRETCPVCQVEHCHNVTCRRLHGERKHAEVKPVPVGSNGNGTTH